MSRMELDLSMNRRSFSMYLYVLALKVTYYLKRGTTVFLKIA